MTSVTRRSGACPHVPSVHRFSRSATGSAEPVLAVPKDKSAGQGEDRAVPVLHDRADPAKGGEAGSAKYSGQCRLFGRGEVGSEARALGLVDAEEDHLGGVGKKILARWQSSSPWRFPGADQVALAPDRKDPALGVGKSRALPVCIATKGFGTIERDSRVMQYVHGPRNLTQHRTIGNHRVLSQGAGDGDETGSSSIDRKGLARRRYPADIVPLGGWRRTGPSPIRSGPEGSSRNEFRPGSFVQSPIRSATIACRRGLCPERLVPSSETLNENSSETASTGADPVATPRGSPPPDPSSQGETGAYRVLARKYRPTTFAELIGQEPLVRTLTNALASGRLAHAFMLSGVRGIGKTTTARIIARALNCVGTDGTGGPTATPCGTCAHCTAIAGDRHMDVIEMDAASRTGVDEIRELLDGTRYRPTSARYKIYIIDEVHMLSRNAFNALLKTLEEPPEHVRFVFATTEIRKVPITVLSRCQRFDLRRIDADVLVKHLAAVAGRESVEVSAPALHLIARAADGSVRDALSLLDQAIAHGQGRVDDEAVRNMLGLADRSLTFDLLDAVVRGDAPGALNLLADQYRCGADPVEIMSDLLDLTHWLTRIKVVPDCVTTAGVAEAERVRGQAMAERLSMSQATRLWQMLFKGLSEVRIAPAPVQAAEMVLIRIAYAAGLPTPGEALEHLRGQPDSGGSTHRAIADPAGTTAGGRSNATAAPTTDARTSGRRDDHGDRPMAQAAPASPARQGNSPSRVATAVSAPAEVWPGENRDHRLEPAAAGLTSFAAVVDLAREEREAILYGQLISDVHLVRFEPQSIEIRLTGNAPADLAHRLRAFLTRQTGQPWLVAISRETGEPTIIEQRQQQAAERRRQVEAEPLVRAVLDAFPGATLGEVTVTTVAGDPDEPAASDSVETESGPDDGYADDGNRAGD